MRSWAVVSCCRYAVLLMQFAQSGAGVLTPCVRDALHSWCCFLAVQLHRIWLTEDGLRHRHVRRWAAGNVDWPDRSYAADQALQESEPDCAHVSAPLHALSLVSSISAWLLSL